MTLSEKPYRRRMTWQIDVGLTVSDHADAFADQIRIFLDLMPFASCHPHLYLIFVLGPFCGLGLLCGGLPLAGGFCFGGDFCLGGIGLGFFLARLSCHGWNKQHDDIPAQDRDGRAVLRQAEIAPHHCQIGLAAVDCLCGFHWPRLDDRMQTEVATLPLELIGDRFDCAHIIAFRRADGDLQTRRLRCDVIGNRGRSGDRQYRRDHQ